MALKILTDLSALKEVISEFPADAPQMFQITAEELNRASYWLRRSNQRGSKAMAWSDFNDAINSVSSPSLKEKMKELVGNSNWPNIKAVCKLLNIEL